MMDVEKMSNEELAGLLEGTEVNYNASVLDESANRLRTSMHWLPMTEDAVFEDEVRYIIHKPNGYVESAIYNAYEKEFYSAGFDDWIVRESITHYARITEPNK